MRHVWLAVWFVGLVATIAPAWGLSERFNHETMMPSAEVKRGMTGVGKSVFHGTEITEFGVEILGVLEKADLGKDLIIGRILDGPVVERRSGVMGGMSGSPVYIGGRLIGAIAYTWPFEREPVAGITAIEGMLEALDKPERQADLSPFAVGVERYSSLRGPVEILGRHITQVRIVSRSGAEGLFADEHTMLMHRVAPPLFCAGLPEQAREYLREELASYGIEPVAGPGAKRDPVETELVPGAAFGSLLVSGDFDISTGGTVTYRDEDLIIAFGHPFMGLGKVDLPLTTSWIHDFIPCYSRTDKLMSPMVEVGTLTQDRPWAVGGKLGPSAGRVPATLRVLDETRDITRRFRVSVVRHRDLTARFLATSALSAVYSTYSGGGEGMARVRVRVKGSQGHEISRADRYYHQGMLGGAAISTLMQASAILSLNRFRPQEVAELEYEARLSDRNESAAIEGLWSDQTVARAGEDLTLRLQIRPDNGDVVEEVVTLKVPLDVEQGRMRIGVSGGADAMRTRSRLGVLRPTFYSLEDLIGEFERTESADRLFIAASTPTRDISVRGVKLPGLPPFLRSLIQDSPRTDIVTGSGELSVTVDTPWVLYGTALLTIATEDREGRRGRVPPPGAPEPREDGDGAASRALPRGVPVDMWWAASAFAHAGGPQEAYRPFTLRPANQDDEDEEEEENGEEDDEAAEDDKDKDKDEPDEPKDKDAGAVARTPSVWRQTTAAHFSEGETEGVAVRSDGAVVLVPTWERVHQFPQPYVSALAVHESVVYAGSLSGGCVYRIADDEVKLLYDTGEFGVSALVATGDGGLLAATFPSGRIFRISPDGEGAQWCRLDANHIYDLVCDGKGGYWAGVGPGAAVWHIDAEGTARRALTIRQAHVTRLLVVGDELYIATAQKGALYRYRPDRGLVSVFDGGRDDLTALALADDGRILVGTAPNGRLVAVDGEGVATTLYEVRGRGITSVLPFKGRLLAGLGGKGQIVEVVDRDTHTVVREEGESQVPALAGSEASVYAACANPGLLLRADFSAAAEGTLEGAPLDAKRRSAWGRVDWQAHVPKGAQLAVRLRSGNSADPQDGSWSAWSVPVSEPGRARADVPAAQFLQYRLEMTKQEGADPPRLDWLRLAYLPANQPPTVKDAKPEEGQAIQGRFKVTWKMEDPDKDQLQARLLARARGKRDFKTIAQNITKGEYEWNTRTMDDGIHDLRIIVDDSLANPTGGEEVSLDIVSVIIDNTPPELTVIGEPVRGEDGAVTIVGYALDATSNIANISWRIKGEDVWRAAQLEDGMYDWRYKRFHITTHALKDSVEEIAIRARDAAGNVTDRTVKLPAKAEKEEKEEKKEAEEKAD